MGGAKSSPVVTITSADLEQNGGQYKLTGKYALKVNGNDSLSVIGGVPSVVYPVSQAQIDSGEFELVQGQAMDVTQVTDRGQESSAWAMPVYHAGPGTWPGSVPSEPGWWEAGGAGGAVLAYQPKGAPSLAESYTDLTGNQDAVPGVAPTWNTSIGWIFNGSSQYLITNATPNSDQSWSMIVQYTVSSGTGFIAGSSAGFPRIFQLRPSNGTAVQYSNGNAITVTPALSAGNLCVAGNRGYRNGSVEGGIIGSWSGSALPVFIGANNNGGSPFAYWSGSLVAIAIYNNILTAQQVAAVSSAMAAL